MKWQLPKPKTHVALRLLGGVKVGGNVSDPCVCGWRVFQSGLALPIPQDVAKELAENAKKLCAPGKGLLAADESTGGYAVTRRPH